MGSGDPPGLQNRRVASPMSPVRSTRTRFRHFVCNGLEHSAQDLMLRFHPQTLSAVMKT